MHVANTVIYKQIQQRNLEIKSIHGLGHCRVYRSYRLSQFWGGLISGGIVGRSCTLQHKLAVTTRTEEVLNTL